MKRIQLLLIYLLLSCSLLAQEKISGTVSDAANGRPLAGATVRLKKSGQLVFTGSSGEFSLARSTYPDTLTVSFIGYVTYRLVVNTKPAAPLMITLVQATGQLDEVTVSTGYQTLHKERATGSFDQVGNTLFNREVSTDVLSRLDGIASGVYFDKRQSPNQSISVRGLSTLTETVDQPLVVVDNFPYAGDINNINPNDVQSITILKDAAAASIWGTRAGNGVIVITTKKGKYEQPLSVTLNSNFTVSAKPNVFYIPAITSADFIGVERYLFSQGFYDYALSDTYDWPVISPAEELLNDERSGLISQNNLDQQLAALGKHDVRNDFENYVYRDAFSQQQSISLSGGSTTATHLLSIGYDNNLQNLAGDENDRLTINSSNQFRPLKNLTVDAGIKYTQGNTTTDSQGGYGAIIPNGGKAGLYPYAQLADAHGNPLPIPENYREAFTDTAGHGLLLPWNYSPFEETKLADNTAKLSDILLNTGLDYRLLPSLNAQFKYQYEQQLSNTRNYYSPGTYFARNLINEFTQVNGNTLTYVVPDGGILDQSKEELDSYDARGQLNYQKSWNNKNELVMIAGGEVSQSTVTGSSSRDYGYSDADYTSVPVDLANQYPTYDNILGDEALPGNSNFTGLLNRSVSVYANGAYTYDDKYILSGSARRDAANVFGVATNQKWIPLWSAGLSWIASKEDFYHLDAVPFLKLRLTYGYSGNANNTVSPLTTLVFRTPTPYSSINNLPYANIGNYPDPQLRPERVAQLNAAVDFALKDNVLAGSIEYYNKKATDLLGQAPADITAGAGTFVNDNNAILDTRGLDITLNSINISSGTLRWSSTLLFSYNRNTVEKYLLPPASNSDYVGSGSLSPVVGEPAYNIISYRWAGLDPANGNPRAYLGGQISENYAAILANNDPRDLVFSGSALPEDFGSLRNDISWKGLTLSVNIKYEFNFYFRRFATSYNDLFNNWIGYSDFARRWQKPGDEKATDVPSLVYPDDPNRDAVYDYSSATVENGANIRLQDIRLDYQLKSVWPRLPVKGLDIYAYAKNTGILWRANHASMDPDYGTGMPDPFTFSLGCKAEF